MPRGIGRTNASLEASADPGLTIPERSQLSAPSELDVDLVRLGEPGGSPDRDATLFVDPAELLVRWSCGCLEHVRAAGATAISTWPEVEIAAEVGDMLERSLLGDEPHVINVAVTGPAGRSGNGLDN